MELLEGVPRSRRNLYVPLGPTMLLLLLLPPFLASSGLASSMALGTVLAAALACSLVLLRHVKVASTKRAVELALVGSLAIGMHLLLVAFITDVDFARALQSLAAFAIVIVGAGALADLIDRADERYLNRSIHKLLWILLIAGLFGGIHVFQPFADKFSKPVFPFSEPSHLAFTIAPILLYCCASSRRKLRIFYVGFAIADTILLQNLTFAVVCILVIAICFSRWTFAMIGLLAFGVIVYIGATKFGYYTDRLDISGQSNNISALVYLQGWQIMAEAWRVTDGLGYGFQQLGQSGVDVPVAHVIRLLAGSDLNVLDGSFNLSKIISEFGFLGIGLIFGYMFLFVRASRYIRKHIFNQYKRNIPLLLINCSIVSYVIELYIRGAGYFTPTGMLLIAAILFRFQLTARCNVRRTFAGQRQEYFD